MYIFVSHKNILEQDIWAGMAHCPCCNNDSHFHLKKLKHKSHLYGLLPILSYTEKRYTICDNCGAKQKDQFPQSWDGVLRPKARRISDTSRFSFR